MSCRTGPSQGDRRRPDPPDHHPAGARRAEGEACRWTGDGVERHRGRLGRSDNLLGGTEEQKARYLDRIFTHEDIWCQLFSEPDAGSDLANLATRAVRDGDEYVINGAKIWSSGAHVSDMGILIARTDPDAPKHRGISYFAVPMDTPGLTMSPIVDMTTAHSFNQVFFDDMRLPVENRIGEEGDGWRLAKVTLANERVSLSSAGSLWGAGPSAYDLLEQIKGMGPVVDPTMRQKVAGCSPTPKCFGSTGSGLCRPSSTGGHQAPKRRSRSSWPMSTAKKSWNSPRNSSVPKECSLARAVGRARPELSEWCYRDQFPQGTLR